MQSLKILGTPRSSPSFPALAVLSPVLSLLLVLGTPRRDRAGPIRSDRASPTRRGRSPLWSTRCSANAAPRSVIVAAKGEKPEARRLMLAAQRKQDRRRRSTSIAALRSRQPGRRPVLDDRVEAALLIAADERIAAHDAATRASKSTIAEDRAVRRRPRLATPASIVAFFQTRPTEVMKSVEEGSVTTGLADRPGRR